MGAIHVVGHIRVVGVPSDQVTSVTVNTRVGGGDNPGVGGGRGHQIGGVNNTGQTGVNNPRAAQIGAKFRQNVEAARGDIGQGDFGVVGGGGGDRSAIRRPIQCPGRDGLQNRRTVAQIIIGNNIAEGRDVFFLQRGRVIGRHHQLGRGTIRRTVGHFVI